MKLKINVSQRSSCFEEVRYDGLYLGLMFKNSTEVFTHIGVSQETFEEFLGVESMGTYYHEHIKGRYVELKEDDPAHDLRK